MPRDPAKYLHDIRDACTFVQSIAASRSFADFQDDRLFRSAVERELQIAGEALMQFQRVDPVGASRISEHDRIIRFRHVLVHGYDQLDREIVWVVVMEKLPRLVEEVDALLAELDV